MSKKKSANDIVTFRIVQKLAGHTQIQEVDFIDRCYIKIMSKVTLTPKEKNYAMRLFNLYFLGRAGPANWYNVQIANNGWQEYKDNNYVTHR